MSADFTARIGLACAEIEAACSRVDPDELTRLIEAILGAGRIVAYGVGREGLMMRALAMRLYHLGLDAHVVGDMSAPPVGEGDLLLVSAGPGEFSTVTALIDVAGDAKARTACITAQPRGKSALACDIVLTIPAQTMADDRNPAASSVLPMGSLYEGAQYVTFELLILALRDRMGVSAAYMRSNHTNLE